MNWEGPFLLPLLVPTGSHPRSTLSHATLAQPTPNDSKTVTGAFRLPVLTLP